MAQVLTLAVGLLTAGGMVFLRIGSMMALLPAFGEQSVPVRVRFALAVAFTMIVAPAIGPGTFSPASAGAEILTGLFFGILVRLFVIALQMAGSIAAQSTSLSQIFGGGAGTEPQPAIGHLLTLAGLALAVMLGLHVHLAVFMIDSYALVPMGQLLDPAMIAKTGLAEVSRAFGLGFSLAAPFVLMALLYNLTLGVINRAMPQLMVSFIGAPAITAGSLALLAITAPALLGFWVKAMLGFLDNPAGGW